MSERILHDNEVTPEMSLWARAIKAAGHPLGYREERTFDIRTLIAKVEVHTWYGAAPSKPDSPHSGVTLYVREGASTSPALDAQAHGVDVSDYQRAPDFGQIAAAGYSFASIKVSEGMTVAAATAHSHFDNAGAAGLLRGPYVFFRPATSGAVEQVGRFWSLSEAIGTWELPPCLDVEWLSRGVPLGGLTPEVFGGRVVDALRELARLSGRRPLLYSASGFWALLRGHADEAVSLADLWQAAYSSRAPVALEPWPSWMIWQHTDHGSIAGYPGKADLDVFAGTIENMRAWCGLGQTDRAPETSRSPVADAGHVLAIAEAVDRGEEGPT